MSKMSNDNPRRRAYTFTLYGHKSEGELRHWMTLFKTKYWCAGDETCPTTGRQHWQGWMYLTNNKTPSAMRKAARGTHVEPIFDTPSGPGWVVRNEEYCRKEWRNFIQEGELPRQGERGDLIAAAQTATVRDLFTGRIMPSFQQIRVAEKYLEYAESPAWRGASYDYVTDPARIKEHDPTTVYYHHESWHGYDGQKTVVYDWMDPKTYKRIRLGIPTRVNVGGSSRFLRVEHLLQMCMTHMGDHFSQIDSE